MNAPSNAMPQSAPEPQAAATPAAATTQPLYWSVRRELWENRYVYVAPLVVAAVMLVGFLISTYGLPERRRAVLQLDLAHQQAAIGKPYDIAAIILILAGFIIGLFYCLEALHGERRDRSILFWKSLPVSDLTTVLAKAIIPLAVLPLVSFAIIIATQLAMMLMTNVILLANGVSVTTFAQVPVFEQSPALAYGLVTLALWHAPVYAWMLVVSAWAQRATFLWAVLPPLVIGVSERLAFNTMYFASMLKSRLGGSFVHAFTVNPQSAAIGAVPIPGTRHAYPAFLAQVANPIPDPVGFLTTPGLWIGLAVAAGFIALAVWLRRYRDPM